MSSVKQVLENDIRQMHLDGHKRELGRLLVEKMIEEKRRQDEKYRLWLQGTVLASLTAFFLYVYFCTKDIGAYQTTFTGAILALALFFAHVCQKILSLISHGK